MPDLKPSSIQRMLKGSLVVFVGTLLSLFLGFVTKVLFVRFTTQEEYGIFTLALTIATIALIISTLGFENGISRYIAFLKGKNDIVSVEHVIYYSLLIGLFASMTITTITFHYSHLLSKIFNISDLEYPLKIILISVPFFTLSKIFISIYRGFGIVKAKLYFSDIMRPSLYLLFIVIVVIASDSFYYLIYAYNFSVIISFIAILFFYLKKPPRKISKIHNINALLAKNVLFFSLPLLMINILLTIMSWTDTLMIGYFKDPILVGEYNTVYPTASLLSLVINSIAFLYVPTISEYYGKNDIGSIKQMNSTFTKWCFLLTLPMFSMIFLFPEMIIELLFGSRYISAATTLQVLALGFLFNSLFGLNYHTLLTIGKSKLLMYCSLLSAFLNIILNIVLIPSFGILGASIASASSFILIELFMTYQLNKMTGIHPFTNNYLKLILLAILNIALYYYIKLNLTFNYFNAIILLMGLFCTYVIAIIATNSVDQTDIAMAKLLVYKITGKIQD